MHGDTVISYNDGVDSARAYSSLSCADTAIHLPDDKPTMTVLVYTLTYPKLSSPDGFAEDMTPAFQQ